MKLARRQKKLSNILNEYFDSNKQKSYARPILSESSFPVRPHVCEWEIHESPERFAKTFELSDTQQVVYFINEVLKYENRIGHEGVIKIMGKKVNIEVYTHDLNRITELDQEYIREVDFIHRDVLDFGKY